MKCTVCRGPAVIDIRRHNSNFCADHFLEHCRRQVTRAIDDFDMIGPGERVLVAVSGGKDSLALWDILLDLGHDVDGLVIGLGIGEYSATSTDHARRFASERDLRLHEVDLPGDYGFDIPDGSRAARRVPCSACGLSKRHLFDRTAIEGGYDVVVTGHNLDDEAAVLFGNALRWDTEYLRRQSPVLPAAHGFPRKVKPLIRLSERETAAWCVVRGIDYVVDECPMAVGNKHLGYKELLNLIEEKSPGTKASYYLGFLERMSPLLAGVHERGTAGLSACTKCGAPTGAVGESVCAFCRLAERASTMAPVPVEMVVKKSAARRRAEKEVGR